MMKGGMIFLFCLMIFMDQGLGLNYSYGKGQNREKRELLIRSKRRWVLSTIEIEEESPPPYPREATTLHNDKKIHEHHFFRISGMGVDEDPMDVFTIDRKSGVVIVHKAIDREKYPFFHIRFDVMDEITNQAVDRTLAFDVAIKDINDNAPRFEPAHISVPVKENTPEGGLPVNLQAFDSDQQDNDNSRISMTIVSQQPASPKFSLAQVSNTEMQQLQLKGCFDFDKEKIYKVLVEARDHGTPSLSTTSTITLDITDSNTHLPVFTETSYSATVPEMVTKEILRMKVSDADEPNTPASRPVFEILKGNEEGNYMIETDPKTNEGVLKVVKGKDFERTEMLQLEISVKNEEPLFVCKDGVPVDAVSLPPPQTVTVNVQVVDVNDPPVFKKSSERVFEKEETIPGKILYQPQATDEDSDVFRYELVDDIAKWLTIDEKTGAVKSVKPMDRESQHVHDSVYTVKVLAIDDGKPPATGTSTLHIVLGDINDNSPYLVTRNTVLCSHKTMVPVHTKDWDNPPYSAPFTFSFGGENVDELKTMWKLSPTTGETINLISLKTLAPDNYSVPLRIQDQQGRQSEDELYVLVCDCAGGDECRPPLPVTTQLAGPAIGALIAGLLLLLLLLCLCFMCECAGRSFKHIPLQMDEGHQTLIKYNEEGGGTASKAEPPLSPTSITYVTTVTDGLKQAAVALPQTTSNSYQMESQETKTMRSQVQNMHQYSTQYSMNGLQQTSRISNTLRSSGRSMQTWNAQRTNTMTNGFTRSTSLASDRYIADHIDRRIYEIEEGELGENVGYVLREYAYEGNGSRCPSLDDLSFSSWDNNLDFLQDLGPTFKSLGGICHRHMQERHQQH